MERLREVARGPNGFAPVIPAQVRSLGQHLGLKPMQPGGKRRAAIPNLLRAN
jgi:hypothetical protein